MLATSAEQVEQIDQIANGIRDAFFDYRLSDPALLYNASELIAGIVFCFQNGLPLECFNKQIERIYTLYVEFLRHEAECKLKTVLGDKYQAVIEHPGGDQVISQILNRFGSVINDKEIDVDDILEANGII